MKALFVVTAVLALAACEAKAPPAPPATPAAATPAPAATAATLTNFAAYPAAVSKGPKVLPAFKDDQKRYAEFKSRILEAARKGVSFAGRYAVAEVGCGTGCRTGYIIDLTTGLVTDAPVDGLKIGSLGMAYRPNSTLFVAHWPSDDWKSCVWQTFEMKGGAFSKITDAHTDGECPELNPEAGEVARSTVR